MGWLAAMIVTEEIARASSSLRVQINMQTIGTAHTCIQYGSESLKSPNTFPNWSAPNILADLPSPSPMRVPMFWPCRQQRKKTRSLAVKRLENMDLQRRLRRPDDLLCLYGPIQRLQGAFRICHRTEKL
jgi:hypothetical protein